MQQLKREYRRVFRKPPFYVLALTVLFLQGCFKAEETDLQKQQNADEAKLQTYFDSNKLKQLKDARGFYFTQDSLIPANPQVKANDILVIGYRVSTLDNPGVAFEDSLHPKLPVKLRALTQQGALLPIGLDAGLGLMRKGERYTFYVPSTLAFGNYSYSSSFPANSNLIIEVRIDEILNDTQEKAIETDAIQKYLSADTTSEVQSFTSGLFYQRIQAGTGDLPISGRKVTLNYVGKYLDGKPFDRTTTTPFTFTIGNSSVIKGFEEGITKMRKGEKGRIVLPSSLGYDASLQVIPQKIKSDLVTQKYISDHLPPFSPLVFEVEILDIQ